MRAIFLALFISLSFPSYANNLYGCSVHLAPTGFVQYSHVAARINIHIDRNDDNRGAVLEFESESYYSRSDFSVEGSNTPTVWNFDYRDLDSGTYVGTLIVNRLEGGKWKETTCQSGKLVVLDSP